MINTTAGVELWLNSIRYFDENMTNIMFEQEPKESIWTNENPTCNTAPQEILF